MMSELMALVVGTFVSEDLACVAAAVLINSSRLDAGPAIFMCGLGIYLGDLGLWVAGRVVAARVLRLPRVRALLPASGADRYAAWFNAHARGIMLGSRFTPGTRLPLYLAAGACRTSFRAFAGWSFVAVSLWTPLVVGLVILLGEQIAVRVATGLSHAHIATGIILGGAVVTWRAVSRLVPVRTRQRAVAAASRLWRWEFWPMWLFYAPVAAWTAILAVRYGGFRTLSSANPGMPDGGIVGESKFAILSRLPSEWIVPSRLIDGGPPAERTRALESMIADCGWTFPLVFKPDVGQRGSGVRLVGSIADGADYLRVVTGPVVVQPFHPGPCEAGVFYYRFPGAPHGRILSITDKRFPMLTGDGRSSIEELVWAHPRYRMQARTFLARFGDRAKEVPGAGEAVRLALAGNHAQGTMFRDGRELITPALESRIDGIARAYEGFFIGRFDIRYGSREAFMDGRDLAIVELNGATAESTNIYDPSRSLLSAYEVLFHQWHLVFAIGAANRRAGHESASTRRLLSLIRTHLGSPSVFPVSD